MFICTHHQEVQMVELTKFNQFVHPFAELRTDWIQVKYMVNQNLKHILTIQCHLSDRLESALGANITYKMAVPISSLKDFVCLHKGDFDR